MANIYEIGPTLSVDPNQWGENYSERRHLDSIEGEIAERHFIFSFARHLRSMRVQFPDVSQFHILDSGCGEGSAVVDLVTLGRKLGIPLTITAITRDPRHKANLINWADEVVIGTTEHFFETEERNSYYHFILDYQGALGALGSDNASEIIPIYGRILIPGGSALLTLPFATDGSSHFETLNFMEENGLIFRVGSRNCAFFSRERPLLWR